MFNRIKENASCNHVNRENLIRSIPERESATREKTEAAFWQRRKGAYATSAMNAHTDRNGRVLLRSGHSLSRRARFFQLLNGIVGMLDRIIDR